MTDPTHPKDDARQALADSIISKFGRGGKGEDLRFFTDLMVKYADGTIVPADLPMAEYCQGHKTLDEAIACMEANVPNLRKICDDIGRQSRRAAPSIGIKPSDIGTLHIVIVRQHVQIVEVAT